ncbi:MAG: GH32 C-terminal domain-containing protein [Bacillota bacterium]
MKKLGSIILIGLFLTTAFTGSIVAEEIVRELNNPNFETGDLSGWQVIEGNAFSDKNVTDLEQESWFGDLHFDHSGEFHLWGYIMDLDEDKNPIYDKKNKNGDSLTGVLRSNSFVLSGTGEISFLVGGGQDLDDLYVALVRKSDAEILKKATGNNSERYRRVWWDASEHLGDEVYIEVVDNSTKSMGHINVDDFNVYHQDSETINYDLDNLDFGTGELEPWLNDKGNAFKISKDYYIPEGDYHLSSYADNKKTGVVKSESFTLGGKGEISFNLKSNLSTEELYVALYRKNDDKRLFKASGDGQNEYKKVNWDLIDYLGEELYLKIVDNSKKGSLAVDNFDIKKEGLIAHWPFEKDRDTIAFYKSSENKDIKLEPKAIDYSRNIKDDINYVFNDAKYKPSSPPLWRNGIIDNGLLFDGYSTWIRRSKDNIAVPKEKLTIEAWVAPRSYEWGDGGQLSAIVNQHNKSKLNGYILGMGRHGSWSLQLGTGRGWHEIWSPEDKILEKGKWSYIVGVFDGQKGELKLYLNGELIAEKEVASNSISPATEDLLIGKHNQAIKTGPFSVNMFSGIIDELKIYNEALSASKISDTYKQVADKFKDKLPVPDLRISSEVYAGDRYRPQYHLITESHWMNEPHAPVYYETNSGEGKYHIFYQRNPQGPYWHQIHWGHLTSDDLVHWEEMPAAIAPQEPVTPDGVWSGDAIINENNEPVIFYTAGNDERGRAENKTNQNIAVARAENSSDTNLENWILDNDLVIEQTNEIANMNALSFDHFRDPYLWQDKATGDYYMLVGSGLIGQLGGTAVLFKSSDPELNDWEMIGNFLKGEAEQDPITGHIWELPVLLPLRDQNNKETEKYIFLINPWFADDSPYAVKFVPYWIGELKRNEEGMITGFKKDHEKAKIFDYGENFTGPSGFVSPDGRSILFSIAQGKRTSQQHYDSGWAHNGGLPLSLYLEADDNDNYNLRFNPIKELNTLRQEKLVDINDKSLKDTNQNLENVGGDLLEIKVEFKLNEAAKYGLKLRKSPNGEEKTLVYYDAEDQTINIDRNSSSKLDDVAKGIQGGKIDLNDDGNLSLHIYIDRSMVEVYANNSKSLTSRVYPTRADSLGLELIDSDSEITIKNLEIWRLGSAYTENGSVQPAYYGN